MQNSKILRYYSSIQYLGMHKVEMSDIIIFMNQLTSSPTSLDKLKTVFFLGLTCNFTTFAGCTVIWVILAKNSWVSGFWEMLFTVIAFAPVFMGDAINNYTLGRIKIEQQQGWDDVQISVSGREKVARYYKLYRFMAILPAYLLAAAIVATFGAEPTTVKYLKVAFFVAFTLNFFRANHLLQCFIAPRLPAYGGKALAIRSFIIASIFAIWYIYFWFYEPQPMSKLAIFGSGSLYFLLNAILQPLPTRYSLLRPSKPRSRAAFFTIEILSEGQLQAIPGAEKIDQTTLQPLFEMGFTFLGNIRMPLIELPLFQAWGKAMVSSDGKTMALLLGTEVKKGLHHSLIAVKGDRYVITTNFGAGHARLPTEVNYQPQERNYSLNDLLDCHKKAINDDFEPIARQAWPRLENLVKSVIRFLESETVQKQQAKSGTAETVTDAEIKPPGSES